MMLKKYLILTFLVPCILFGDQKTEVWKETEDRIDQITDALGFPIDNGIRDVVVALNALGIETMMSCEGHLDRAQPFPWVFFSSQDEEIFSLANKVQILWKSVDEMRSLPKEEKNESKLDELYDEIHNLNQKIEVKRYKKMAFLQTLLKEFYSQRSTDYEQMLCVVDYYGFFGLQPCGGAFMCLSDEIERMEKLPKFRAEMDLFALFLKQKFFEREHD